jgi:hypothetical protein
VWGKPSGQRVLPRVFAYFRSKEVYPRFLQSHANTTKVLCRVLEVGALHCRGRTVDLKTLFTTYSNNSQTLLPETRIVICLTMALRAPRISSSASFPLGIWLGFIELARGKEKQINRRSRCYGKQNAHQLKTLAMIAWRETYKEELLPDAILYARICISSSTADLLINMIWHQSNRRAREGKEGKM